MQPSARTPNSILRSKRVNKENDDTRAIKRNKLATRRVSFAPDDELETRHLYSPKAQDSLRQHHHVQYGSVHDAQHAALQHQHAAQQEIFSFNQPPEAVASPAGAGDLSPMSMDLTNNSFQQAGPSVPPAGPFDPSMAGPQDFTRNITLNVPNLATLVEEDEEAAYDAMDAPPQRLQHQALRAHLAGESPAARMGLTGIAAMAPSPVSPFVLREMQRQPEPDDDEVRNRWGYVPGADDTLDVSYGHAVLGDTTYNHVYGSSTTGEITHAVRAAMNAGGPLLQPGGVTTRRMSSAAANAARNTGVVPNGQWQPQQQPTAAVQMGAAEPTQTLHMMLPPLPVGGAVPPSVAVAPPTQTMENTMKLLADDQTDAWRLQYAQVNTGRVSVASNRLPNHRRYGETTNLLGNTAQLLNTGNMTQQLLADSTGHTAVENYFSNMQRQPSDPFSRDVCHHAADATAASISGLDRGPELKGYGVPSPAQPRMVQQQQPPAPLQAITAELHMDLGNNMDLLAEGADPLAAFPLPPEPEPTMDLSLEIQQRSQAQFAQHANVTSTFDSNMMLSMHTTPARSTTGAPGALPAPEVAPPPPVPSISCQDFLCFMDVSFNDKVCRTSYLPQSDPPPKSDAEVFEAALVTMPRVAVYQQLMIDLSSKLASTQANVQRLEAEMSASNPPLFTAAQRAQPKELETIRDQMVNLKRLCRIHTVKAIKQAHLSAWDELLHRLDGSKAALVQELEAVKENAQQLDAVDQGRMAVEAAIARHCEQEEQAMQAAVAKRKALEGQLARLEDLRAQNTQRIHRMEAARSERDQTLKTQVPKAQLQERKAQLEAELQKLQQGSASALTPMREGQFMRQVAAKQEELDALLNLHGQQLDLANLQRTGEFTLTIREHFRVRCNASNSGACTLVASTVCASQVVKCAFPTLAAAVDATVASLHCSMPCRQLPQALEWMLMQLHRITRLVDQLERSWQRLGCMLKPEVRPSGPTAENDSSSSLILTFLNADTVTRISIAMPWEAALQCDMAAPRLEVSMLSLEPSAEYVKLLQSEVLEKLGPRRDYMEALCLAMSFTIQTPDVQQQPGGADSTTGGLTAAVSSITEDTTQRGLPLAAQLALPSTPGMLAAMARTPARMFNNPLFTTGY